MEKPLLLQGKIPKLQQLFGKNWQVMGTSEVGLCGYAAGQKLT